ncbi:ATP-grasp domain-containing protein [Staphylococcus caprae]|uniref:ATP-grasp domain-containing protein n=1 Tax=Staphylococcus caprae TaxID=29380 RepID=UPI003B223145
MTVIILSNTDGNKTPYDAWFPNAKENIILFCPQEKAHTFNQHHFLFIESFENYVDNVDVEIKAIQLSKKYNITNILSISEFDVVRSAKLREILHCPGQSLISAEAYRNKLLMKQLLHGSSVNIPKFEKVISKAQVENFVQQTNYPVVLKPIYGSGSMDVFIAKNQQDIDTFFEENRNINNYEIEGFINGDMYHVDGLIHNNKVIVSYVSKYYKGCLEFQKNQPLASYMVDESNALNITFKAQAEKVIDTLPSFPNGSFHAEFFLTDSGEIYFCEIGSRTGGAEVGNVIQNSTNIHLNKESLYMQMYEDHACTIQQESVERYSGFVLLPPQNGVYKGIKKHLVYDWIVKFKNTAQKNKTYNDAQFSVDHIISVLIEGNNEQELISRINIVTDWYEKNVIWEQHH